MLIVGRMVHPPLFLIKCLLFAVPLLCCACSARRFLRKSHQRFSLPFLRLAALCFSVPLLRVSRPSLSIATPSVSQLLSAAALLRQASLCHCYSSLFCSLLCHCTAVHLIAFALHRRALPLPGCATLSHRTANRTQPCHCNALPRSASANQGRQCHAVTLLCTAMPLLSGLHLIGSVGKAALSAVAPLADAAQNAIIQPLTHNLFVAVVKKDYVKLACASRRDFLTVDKAHALALCGLSTQRTLAVADLSVCQNRNHAGLNEDQAVNDLLVSSQLAAFVHGLLLASLGLAADAGKHAASILKHAFDLVIVKNRIAVRVTRENGHALVSYRIRAKSRHFILDGCSIRRLAGDKLAGHIGVCGPCAKHRLNKRSFHMQFFHSNLQNKFVFLRHAVVLPLQKQVHKVDLTFASHLGGLVDAGMPIGVHHGGLLDLKQTLLHGALRWHIVVAALWVSDEVSVLPHPDKQPILPDLHAVLAQQLCKFTHKDALLAGVYRVCKDALGRKFRDLPVFVLQFIVGGNQSLRHQFSPGKLRALRQLLLHLIKCRNVLQLPFQRCLAGKAHGQQRKAVPVHQVLRELLTAILERGLVEEFSSRIFGH
nr:MAG TPA_asm: hypothetical protein [Caudoviricetes sp.]